MNFAAQPGARQFPSHDDPEYKKWLEEEQKLIDRYQKRPNMSWRDHLVMLLTFGAAAEHCLMVQYLYGAYSLHTEVRERGPRIENWRSNILTICKEEMGHLLTVQNILLLLGTPTTLGREDSIWAEKYYPFPFSLDPLNLDSLRCFVYAEMPDPDSKTFKELPADDRRMLKELTKNLEHRFRNTKVKADVHRVGALYAEIIDLIANEKRIPDSDFDEASLRIPSVLGRLGPRLSPGPIRTGRRGKQEGIAE